MEPEDSAKDAGVIKSASEASSPGSRDDQNDCEQPNVVTLSSDDEDTYTNPEPPRELLENQLLGADTIGDTVFSKHWLFTTLMKLIEAVDKEEHTQHPDKDSDLGLDLEDSLQDELCKLWDMSMNPAVVTFLMEFKAIDLLSGVISKSKAPRAIEICVGILGNMACTDHACSALSQHQTIRSLALLLLGSPDTPTLVETTRLLNICVSSAAVSDLWISSITNTPAAFDSLTFMLQSSRNVDLLTNAADVIDKAMDMSDALLMRWSTVDLVQAILEAVKQCGSRKDAIDTYLHILQLVSTCEPGVEALGHQSEPLCQLTLQYLIQLCAEDIVVLDGQEDAVGSALSVLATAFTALDDKTGLLAKDFQMMRCLLKLLYVVYPKLRSFSPGLRTQRSRSDSKGSDGEGQRSRTCSGDQKLSQSTSESKSEESKSSEEKASEESGTKENPLNISDASVNSPDDPEVTCTMIKGPVAGPGVPHRPAQPPSALTDSGVLEMLYEVLQNILTDVILVLSEDDGMISEVSTNGSPDSSEANVDKPADPSKNLSSKSENKHEKPLTLTYLNDHCERRRIKLLVHTLDEVFEDTELDCNTRLSQVAHDHGLSRLASIVEQYSAG